MAKFCLVRQLNKPGFSHYSRWFDPRKTVTLSIYRKIKLAKTLRSIYYRKYILLSMVVVLVKEAKEL